MTAFDDYPELVVLKGGQLALDELDQLRDEVEELRDVNDGLRVELEELRDVNDRLRKANIRLDMLVSGSHFRGPGRGSL